MKSIVALIMFVIGLSRAFFRSSPQKVHLPSAARRGYSSSLRVLFTALGSTDDAQQAFDQLPSEVKKGFGGYTRKKKVKPTSSVAVAESNDNGETISNVEIPAPPPLVFSLGSHLTGKRVDLTWQYRFNAAATSTDTTVETNSVTSSPSSSSSSSSSAHPSINPWGPVRKSAELKAIRVLLQPGESTTPSLRSNLLSLCAYNQLIAFTTHTATHTVIHLSLDLGEFTSSSQLSVDRLRQIAKECVPAPWLASLLLPQVSTGDESKDNTSRDITSIASSGSSTTISSTSSGADGGGENSSGTLTSTRQRTTVSHADFLATLAADGGDHMLLEQALSLRKQLLVDKIINDGWKLRKLSDRIHKAYHRGDSLLELARQYDLPPVAIFRDMLTSRVRNHRMFDGLRDKDKRNVVKCGLRGDGSAWDLLMTARDKQQLAIAKSVDHTSYAEEDSTERLRSSHWEGTKLLFLIHHCSGVF